MSTDPVALDGVELERSMLITFNASELPTVGQQDAFVYWTQLPMEGGLPVVDHIDPLTLPRSALPLMAILDVSEADFRVRLAGTGLTDMLGKEFTGTRVSQLPDADQGTERLRWAVQHRKPYYARSRLTWAEKQFRNYGVLTLPFGRVDVVDRLVLVFDFESVLI